MHIYKTEKSAGDFLINKTQNQGEYIKKNIYILPAQQYSTISETIFSLLRRNSYGTLYYFPKCNKCVTVTAAKLPFF